MNFSRVKMRHLHVLVAVARHGHVTKAARALALSQPAVSKTLMDLEDIVGRPVLRRSARGATLTPDGAFLVQYAGSALRMLREGFELLAGQQTIAPAPIAIGVLPTAGAAVLPAALERYRHHHPAGRLKVVSGHYGELLSRLKRGELDLVLGRQAEPAEMTGLSFEPLYTEELVFAVRRGHPLTRSAPARILKTIHQFPLLLPTEGSIIRRAADEFLMGHGIPPPTATVESVDGNFSRAYTQRSNVVWVAPAGVAAQDMDAGILVQLPLDTSSTRAAVGLTLKAGVQLSAQATDMAGAIRATIEERLIVRRRAPSARARSSRK